MAQSRDRFIEWSDERYSTDIDRFDEQHKHLFGLLNDLHVALEEGHPEETVGDILRELERYTEYHFGDEEEFMQDCGYAMDCADCFYNHREFHEEFVETVKEFRERHENGEPITLDVLEFTKEWLDAHIGGEDVDQNYSEYYQETVPGDYEYEPGKLNKERDGTRTYEAETDAVTLRSDVHVGGDVSVPRGSMADWFGRLVDRHGDRSVALVREGEAYVPRTFQDLYEQAWRVASGLLDAGVEPGSTLGICARPSYAWSVVDMACYLGGIVSVPIYPELSEERAVATETTAGVETLVADDSASEAIRDAAGTVFDIDALPTGERRELPGFDADPDDVATVVSPLDDEMETLGYAVTHRNLLAAAASLGEQFQLTRESTGTCLLPLAHTVQRVATYYLWDSGSSVAYIPPDELTAGLETVEPDVLVGVSRVYEHLRSELEAGIDDLGRVRGRLADGAAMERGKAVREGTTGSLTDSAAGRVVFAPLRDALGLDNLDYALSDSLDPDLVQFLWGCGLPLHQVYGGPGLTGVGFVSEYGTPDPAALGRPLPGVEAAVTDDSEIAVRGDTVVSRYWETSDVLASATSGDWCLTGDTGEFDSDGRLHRTE